MQAKTCKKALSLLLTLAMLCGMLVTTALASSNSDSVTTLKNGTTDPTSGTYVIYDQDDMDAFVSYVNAGRNTSGLTFKIDGTGNTYNVTSVIAAPTTVASASTSSPYISAGTGFKGTFDGNGNTINVTLSTSASGTGLFGYLAPAGKVENLNVTGTVTVTGSKDAVGGVVGYNSGIIDNVTSSVTVSATSAYNVGGIAGFNDAYYMTGAKGTIRNSANTGAVTGYSKVGGITGENAGTISSCYNTANITGTYTSKNGVGGIAGRAGNNNTAAETSTIQYCYNTGAISVGTGKWAGGICGFENSKSTCVSCFNTGNITATSYKDHISGNTEGSNSYCFGLSTATGIEGYDGATSVSDDQLKGNGSISVTINNVTYTSVLSALNAPAPRWEQTTGTYPTLLGSDEAVAPAAAGTSSVTPTLETDGVILGGDSEDAYTDLSAAMTAAASTTSKTVYVAGEIALSGSYTGVSGVTIKRSATYTGYLFTVGNADGTGTATTATLSNMVIDGNSNNGVVGSNLIRTYTGANLTLESTVTLQNSVINANGGAIHVQGGTVNCAATIKDCSARNGGAVYISGGSFTLTGSISGCSAQLKGAGIYLDSDAEGSDATSLTITGGTVGNTIYLNSGEYITVGSALAGTLTVESAVTTSGTVIVKGSGYTLTVADQRKLSTSGFNKSLDSTNNQIVFA